MNGNVLFANAAALAQADGLHWDDGGRVFKVLLAGPSYVPRSTDVYVASVRAELVGTGYERLALSSRSVVFDPLNARVDNFAASSTWASINAGTAAWAIVYRHATNDADSVLVCAIDLRTTAHPSGILTTGGPLQIDWGGTEPTGRVFSAFGVMSRTTPSTFHDHFGDALTETPDVQEIGGYVRYNGSTGRIEHVATHIDARAWIAKYGGDAVGTTDCTAALNLALAAGSHVHLAPDTTGNQYLCKGLVVPSGVEFTGHGGSTLVRDVSSADGTAIISRVGARATLRDLEFDGQRVAGDLTGIGLSFSGLSYRAAVVVNGQVANADNFHASGLKFRNIHGGSIMVQDAESVLIEGCESDDCAFELFFVSSPTSAKRSCHVRRCRVRNMHAQSVDPSALHADVGLVSGYSNVIVQGVDAYDFDAGIKFQSGANTTCEGVLYTDLAFEKSTFKNFGIVDVQVDAADVTISNVVGRDLVGGIFVGKASVIHAERNLRILDCTLENVHTNGASYQLADAIQIQPSAGYHEVSGCVLNGVARYPVIVQRLAEAAGKTCRVRIADNRIIAGDGAQFPAPSSGISGIRVFVENAAGGASCSTDHVDIDNNTVEGYGETGSGAGAIRVRVGTGALGNLKRLDVTRNKVRAPATATLTTSPIQRQANGQADLSLTGTPTAPSLQMRVKIDGVGAGTGVGQATFAWTQDGGHTWTRLVTTSSTPIALGTTGYSVAWDVAATFATSHAWSWVSWFAGVALQLDGIANRILDGNIEGNLFEGTTVGSEAATALACGPNDYRGAHNLTVGVQRGRGSVGTTDQRPCFHRAGDTYQDVSLAPSLPLFSDGSKLRDATGAVSAPQPNLIIAPLALEDSSWTYQRLTRPASADINTSATTDPFGGTEADEVRETTDASATHQFFANPTRTAGVTTFTIYVKADADPLSSPRDVTKFEFVGNNLAVKIDFDIATGAISTVAGAAQVHAKSLDLVGDDWWRFQAQYDDLGSTVGGFQIRFRNDAGSVTYTGDGQSGAFFAYASAVQ